MDESVKHFLLKCPKYNIQRHRLKKKLRKITIWFKDEIHFNLTSILFPHTWQTQPDSDDLNRKTKFVTNIHVRILVFRAVMEFVNSTKRFTGDFGV